MQKVIIADTSCLILLDKIEELKLLNKLPLQWFVSREPERDKPKDIRETQIIEVGVVLLLIFGGCRPSQPTQKNGCLITNDRHEFTDNFIWTRFIWTIELFG